MGPGTGGLLEEGGPFLFGAEKNLVFLGRATFYSSLIGEP